MNAGVATTIVGWRFRFGEELIGTSVSREYNRRDEERPAAVENRGSGVYISESIHRLSTIRDDRHSRSHLDGIYYLLDLLLHARMIWFTPSNSFSN